MLTRHVGWQLESLGVEDPAVARALVDRFAGDVEQAAAVNRRVLATLVEQGYRLGAVSNACGNAAVLCEEYGYGGMLSAIVDSHRFGASKPDLAIFRHALDVMKASPGRTAFVGDSLDRDIAPARALGLRTFWISNRRADAPAGMADVVLESVEQLPARLLEIEARAGLTWR
jgi:HAD superfamily hydrolase (TIGR01509 family)